MPCEHVPWTSPAAGLVFAAAALAICFKLAVAAALYTKRKEDAVRFTPTTLLYPCAAHPTTSLTPLRAPPAQVRFAQPMLSSLSLIHI